MIWSHMLRGCVQIRFYFVFEFSFMNGSSFEPCSHHFGRVCYVVAFQIRFHESQSNMTQLLCLP